MKTQTTYPTIIPDTIHRGPKTGHGSYWIVGVTAEGREYGLGLTFRPEGSKTWTVRLSGNGIDLRLDGFATRGDAVRAVRDLYRSAVLTTDPIARLRAATIAAVANALDVRGIRHTVDVVPSKTRADRVLIEPISEDAPAYPAVAVQNVSLPGGHLEAQTDYEVRWIPDA